MTIRISSALTLITAAALLTLGGCASRVKLDDSKPAPIVDSSATRSVDPNAGASSAVAPVVTTPAENVDPAAGLAKVIYFDYDSYVVKPEYNGTLDGYAKLLGNKARRLTVEGHTDARGSREYNLALGQKRAEALVKAMEVIGVPASQLQAVSFGKEKPKASGNSAAAYAENRRDDIVYNQ